MESFEALKKTDEVRTFPDIQMPAPSFKVHTGKGTFTRSKDILADKKAKVDLEHLPGLLKTKKTILDANRAARESERNNIFTGFNNVNIKLDVASSVPRQYDDLKALTPMMTPQATGRGGLNALDLSSLGPSAPNTNRAGLGTAGLSLGSSRTAVTQSARVGGGKQPRLDNAVEELRNYIVLMDKYSLHNFLIYDGHALRDTPEFQSFQRSYQHQWGAISSIIMQLEEFLSKHDIKLAIVNGPRLVEMSKLNLPTLKRAELLSCLANSAQIETSIESGSDFARKQLLRSVVQIQAAMRMFLCKKRYRSRLQGVRSAIRIQSMCRRLIERIRHRFRTKRHALMLDDVWARNQQRLKDAYANPVALSNTTRLIIFLPSISTHEKIRLEYDNYAAMQNTSICQLYALADPNVNMLYISPVHMSQYQVTYLEKFLSLLGISILPKRLHILVPEMVDKLPPILPLSQQLWYSNATIKKVRAIMRRFKHVEMRCSTLGWAEKRIANYLDIPIMSCEPGHAQVLSTRSVLKNFFMESSVSISIGAHDVCSLEDLLVALARLVSSNLGVMRWVIRFNHDHNQESVCFVDIEKLSILPILRNEQREVIGEKESLSAWFSRPVQIEVRKRLLAVLRNEFLSIVRLSRRDIYPTWDAYMRQICMLGAVIEGEPIEKLGTVISPVFISPNGEITQLGGVEGVCDDFGQVQAYIYPQHLTPPPALQSVTDVLVKRLHEEQHVVGHVSLHFTSLWDGLDNVPRLWAQDIQFGCSPVFGAFGTAGVMCSPGQPLPVSLLPSLPADRSFVYIPCAVHDRMKDTRDDHFFKLCRMKGIAFDTESKIGTLFFMHDSLIGGGVSVLCMGATRKKSIEIAINTLTFITKNYGLDMDAIVSRKYENLSNILSNLRKIYKREGDVPIAV
eukprot:gene24300-29379_t